jgi:hypothetical protein
MQYSVVRCVVANRLVQSNCNGVCACSGRGGSGFPVELSSFVGPWLCIPYVLVFTVRKTTFKAVN